MFNRPILLEKTVCSKNYVMIVIVALAWCHPAWAEIALVEVASGFTRPTFVTAPPGDRDRLFVTQQNDGHIRIVRDGRTLDDPFLDLSSRIEILAQEHGLGGLAFHPRYSENGLFFVSYTDLEGNSIVERYQVSGDPDVADPESATLLFKIDQPRGEHNVGMLIFGPDDGYLYVGVGDGGFTFQDNAQDMSSPYGSILRLDVDGAEPWEVPADNPFVGVEGVDERIWCYGLRAPWRFDFDTVTGDVFIGDVGESQREEVNRVPAETGGGLNFGWPILEGDVCRGFRNDCEDVEGLTPPTVNLTRSIFRPSSVIGGCVYRGEAIPDLTGAFLFADFNTGAIRSLRTAPDGPSEVVELTADDGPLDDLTIGRITSFGKDADGEVYVVAYDLGAIYKFVNSRADVDGNGSVDAIDVQVVINGALGLDIAPYNGDVSRDGSVDALDVQSVINGALGISVTD
jgi:glucose/arabinose dehydrogenase